VSESTAPFRFDNKMNFDFRSPPRGHLAFESALREAEEAQFVRRLEEVPLAYFFKHNLIQEASYTTLTRHERKRLHTVTAHVMEADAGAALDAISAQLAQHYAAAGDDVKTLEYAARAAGVNQRNFAIPEARLHYAQALEALERLADSVERRRCKVDLGLRRLELLWSTGTAEQDLRTVADLENLTQTLLREQVNTEQDRLLLARVHSAKAGLYFAKNQVGVAMNLFQQVLTEGADLGDEELLASPSQMIAGGLVLKGMFAQALPLAMRAWSHWQNKPERWEWSVLVYLVMALVNLGRAEQARALLQSIPAELDIPESSRAMTFINISLANVYLVEYDYEKMADVCERGVTSSRAGDDRVDLYIVLALEAVAESYLGRTAAARAHMAESQQLLRAMGGQIFQSDSVAAMCAQVTLNLGDAPQAAQLAEEAVNFARSIGGWYAQGLAERIWGLALAQMGPPFSTQALEHMKASLAALEACEALLERARARVILADLLQKRGEPATAREQLEQAAAQFEAMGLAHEMEKAQMFLNKVKS